MNTDRRTLSSRSSVSLGILGILGIVLAACSGASSETTAPPPASPAPSGDDTATVREALEFDAPCTASACGETPASSTSTKPKCSAVSGACAWSDPSPNGSVSYRQCEDTACGTKPDASVCPAGTTFKGAQCGSENEGACVWRSACTPPPSTIACADVDGCGPQPAIGVICKDGTSGGLLCMKQGAKCAWQRSCE